MWKITFELAVGVMYMYVMHSMYLKCCDIFHHGDKNEAMYIVCNNIFLIPNIVNRSTENMLTIASICVTFLNTLLNANLCSSVGANRPRLLNL